MRLSTCVAVLALFPVGCRSPQGTPEDASAVKDDQTPATPGDVFSTTDKMLFDGKVNEIHIVLHGETWGKVTGEFACKDEAPYGHIKEFKFVHKGTGKIVVMNNAGLQVKGNTSCDDPIDQKGFKVKFNPVDKFINGENGEEIWRIQKVFEEWGKRMDYSEDTYKKIKAQSLFGMKTITLRRGGIDPTRMRDVLSTAVFSHAGEIARQEGHAGAPLMGGPAYRGGLAWVKFTNGFGVLAEGLYTLVENTDEDMVAMRYGEAGLGSLYKIREAKGSFLDSDMPSNRDHLFSYYEPKAVDGDEFTDAQEYGIKQKLCQEGKLAQSKCDKIEKQWKKAEEGLRALRKQLTEAMAIPDAAQRREKIKSFLDVDNILSYAVVANLIGHWDSAIGAMSNNDFVHFHKQTKKWGIVAWDLDNTFGTPTQNYPWMANLTDFGVDLKYRPLFKAVLDNFGEEYKARAGKFLENGFGYERLGGHITYLRDNIAPGSTEEKYEILYKFKDHRWGNAYCHLKKGPGSRVKINNGWPKIFKQGDGKYAADCT